MIALSIRLASDEAHFQTKPCKLHRLESGPSTNATVTRKEALNYYRQMVVCFCGHLYRILLIIFVNIYKSF